MASIWASIRPGIEPVSRAEPPRPAPMPPPSPAMKAAVREAVGSDPEPRRPPPRLGPARIEPPHPAIPPRAAAVAVRRTGWGYAIAWSLGIGVGAVAAGAFVGFLVNGPPGHSSSHRQVADVAPPTPDVPPPTAQEIVSSKRTPTTVPTAAPAKDSPSSLPAIPAANGATTTAGRTALPPIPPAKPSPQAAPTRSSPPSPPLSSSNDIRELQGRLQSLGFDPGTIDGANGPKTAAAVTRYQQARGLQPTGIADKDMLAELRQEPGATAPPPPPPPRPRTQSYQYASPPPHQSNPLVDALNRLFGR